ncbi:hypothetical protein HGRIS_005441 [Hohenbuehelia grisea]|uniref:Uncharacterized protein n=1 Tax=Hohenbuehelia grisea TaxID=104357 RepID=A0ABR3JZ64_9AGAR
MSFGAKATHEGNSRFGGREPTLVFVLAHIFGFGASASSTSGFLPPTASGFSGASFLDRRIQLQGWVRAQVWRRGRVMNPSSKAMPLKGVTIVTLAVTSMAGDGMNISRMPFGRML